MQLPQNAVIAAKDTMNFAVREENRVTATVLRAYNFESDDEYNVNTDDLSDLSDVFDEVPKHLPLTTGGKNDLNDSSQSISIDDIPYDRDLKYINVPNGSRPKPVILQSNRFLKQVPSITNNASTELQQLDQHYVDMDGRKRDHEKKFLVEFESDKTKDGRPSRRGTRGKDRRGARERPEPTGKSRMEM